MCEVNKTEAAEPHDIVDTLHKRRDELAARRAAFEGGAARAYNPAGLSQGAAGTAFENEARRPRLRDRVEHRRRSAAEAAAHEHNDVLRLKELGNLLGKHPDVARILELIEETRV